MVRMIITAGLMAAMVAVSDAQACDACAALLKARQQHEGKLIKTRVILEGPAKPGDGHQSVSLPPQVQVIWKLKTADRTYLLKLGSRTLTRLAAALEGHDVIVTGPLKGDEIDVRDMAARPGEFVGRLERREMKDRPAGWKLVTDNGTYNLIFAELASKKGETWAGKRVRVKGQLTVSGIVVTSVEVEPLWLPICPPHVG